MGVDATVGPERIKRSRSRGWRMPTNAIYVGRPTRWGNPWIIHAEETVIHSDGTRSYWTPNGARRGAVELFARDLHAGYLDIDLTELTGRDLACWCLLPADGEPDWCHAAVLLAAANPRVIWSDPVARTMAEIETTADQGITRYRVPTREEAGEDA